MSGIKTTCDVCPERCTEPCYECAWCGEMVHCDDIHRCFVRFKGRAEPVYLCIRCGQGWRRLTRDDCVFCGAESGDNVQVECEIRLPNGRHVWKPVGVCAECEKKVQ